MRKGIFCSKCGTNNEINHFKCSECNSFVRPIYPTVLAVATLLIMYIQWLFFLKHVVPVFASILSLHGAQFSLFVRTALAVGQHFTGWGALFGLVFFAALIWLGLFWRPQQALGQNLVITIALAKAMGAMMFELLATLDALPFLAMK